MSLYKYSSMFKISPVYPVGRALCTGRMVLEQRREQLSLA